MIRKHSGFTLIELMIVVAIVGLLSAIAYPSYQNQVRKSKRADGKEALLNVQMAQEKWRANHATYSSTLGGANCGTVTATGLCLSSASTGGYYTVTVPSADAVGFVASAAAVGAQASDKEGSTSCTPLTLTVSATNPTGLKAPAACW